MTNADKYLKDGVDLEEFIRDITDNIGIVVTTSDITKPIGISIYADDFKKFLNTPLKPTLTEDEKVILRNLPKDVDSIGRDSDGELEIKMINQNNCNDFGYDWFGWYDKLFQFIQPRRRI